MPPLLPVREGTDAFLHGVLPGAPAMRDFNLELPFAGINRANLYQAQPPYTTPDCLNIRPIRLDTQRFGLSVRPGLMRAFQQQIGSGNPVRMLTSVGIVETQGSDQLIEHFDGVGLAPHWTVTGSPRFRRTTLLGAEAGSEVVMVRTALPIDGVYGYQASAMIVPDAGVHHADYRLAIRLNNASPNVVNDAVYVDLELRPDGAYSFNVVVNKSAATTVLTTGSGSHGHDHPGVLSIEMFRDDAGTPTRERIRVYWRGTVLANVYINKAGDAVTGMPAEATHRRAYILMRGVQRRALIDWYRVRRVYPPASSGSGAIRRRRQAIVAASNGLLYVETAAGRLELASTQSNLQSDRRLYAAEFGQKLYIADNGPILLDHFDNLGGAADATITGTLLLQVAGNPYNFVALGVDPNVHVVEVYSTSLAGSEPVSSDIGVYPIGLVTATAIQFAYQSNLNRSAVRFRIVRGPKVYDPVSGVFTNLRTTTIPGAGVPKRVSSQPINAMLTCVYRNRLGFARTDEAPHAFYFARVNDPGDWDYSVSDTDPQRAFAGTAFTGGALLRGVTAFFSHTDDYCIVATNSTIHVIRGDPAAGGVIDVYTDSLGIAGPGAWCRLPNGAVAFLSSDGVYGMGAGAIGRPEPLSKAPLPDDLRGLEWPNYEFSMVYDRHREGIELWVEPATDGPRLSYFIHLPTGSFWPQSTNGQYAAPTIAAEYEADVGADSTVLFGSGDGYVNRMSDLAHTDSGSPIDGMLTIGPTNLGSGANSEVVMGTLRATLDSDGGPADWSVSTGDTEQEALQSRPSAHGRFVPGTNYDATVRVLTPAVIRVSSPSGYLRTEFGDILTAEDGSRLLLESEPTVQWTLEVLGGGRQPAGRWRKG